MSRVEDADLTRSRIRDAAIARFAVDGFSGGLRAIATDAGVTAGLITHHFGSKAGLRQECDDHVLAVVEQWSPLQMARSRMEELIADVGPDEAARVMHYVLRSLLSGGHLAQRLVERLADTAGVQVELAVAAGALSPTRLDAGRALVMRGVGALLLEFTLQRPQGPEEILAFVRGCYDRATLPVLGPRPAGPVPEEAVEADLAGWSVAAPV